MASKGIGVPFIADVAPFLKGTKDVEGALDGVIDSLDDVAREGKRSSDLISTSFEGMSEDVQAADRRLEQKFDAFFDGVEADSGSASAKMEREFKHAFDNVERSAQTSGRQTSKHISDIPDDARKTSKSKFAGLGEELGGELSQNIGEGISSGKTGVAGALDTVLGTLGGVLPALGPAGAMIGVGALVVGSIVKGILDNQEEVRKAVQKTMSDAYDAAADAFENGPKTLSIADIVKSFTPEQKQALLDDGIDIRKMAEAVKFLQDTGDPSKIEALKKPINDRAAAIKNVAVQSNNLFGSSAPNLFDVGGPLVADATALALMDQQTQAVNANAAAMRAYDRSVRNIPLDKVKAIRAELNKPINQSDSSLRRYLSP